MSITADGKLEHTQYVVETNLEAKLYHLYLRRCGSLWLGQLIYIVVLESIHCFCLSAISTRMVGSSETFLLTKAICIESFMGLRRSTFLKLFENGTRKEFPQENLLSKTEADIFWINKRENASMYFVSVAPEGTYAATGFSIFAVGLILLQSCGFLMDADSPHNSSPVTKTLASGSSAFLRVGCQLSSRGLYKDNWANRNFMTPNRLVRKVPEIIVLIVKISRSGRSALLFFLFFFFI